MVTKRRDGMRLLPGGAFGMGADDFYEDEKPVRQAQVGAFWIDETPVTNFQFGRFVQATGYVTFAEEAPDPSAYPDLPSATPAGSAVFVPPAAPPDLGGDATWWAYVPGACWRQPLGPDSSVAALGRHPVVHVTLRDAEAYAAWSNKALPTEAEWEYAARGGLDRAPYAWGDSFMPGGRRMAKTWDGFFPYHNNAPRGLERTSPVRSYPANGYGLFDMIGNVWEWTVDPATAAPAAAPNCCSTAAAPAAERRILKGGSHLCAPEYCQRYRPAARWPQPIDTSTSHVGFRCIVRV